MLNYKYPHQHLFHHIHSKGLDKLAYVFVIIGIAVGVPQIYQIFDDQSAGDISAESWLGYTAGSIFWIWYGIERKVKPIILSAFLHLVVNVIVLYGIYLYGDFSVFGINLI